MDAVGAANIETKFVAVFWQPFASVPVTVYVTVALGINATPSVTPFDHVYVLAPPPVSVMLAPLQTVLAVVFAVTLGKAFMLILVWSVAVQPNEFVTVSS